MICSDKMKIIKIWYIFLIISIVIGFIFSPTPVVLIDTKLLTVHLNKFPDLVQNRDIMLFLFFWTYSAAMLLLVTITFSLVIGFTKTRKKEKEIYNKYFVSGKTINNDIMIEITDISREEINKLFDHNNYSYEDYKKIINYLKKNQ